MKRFAIFGMRWSLLGALVLVLMLSQSRKGSAQQGGGGTSDVISVHLPLTEQTRDLIGKRQIASMKPSAILINTARGAVVDNRALAAALDAGKLDGAGIDVFDEEPVPPDHPLVRCDQVVLTPHNADQTPEGMDILNGGAVDNVIAFLLSKPQNTVV